MSLVLDHVLVAVHNLDQAIQDYRNLGFNVLSGGVIGSQNIHHSLVCFQDGSYLDLLASADKAHSAKTSNLSSILAQAEGLVGYALRTEDIEVEASRLRAKGIQVGEIFTEAGIRPDGKQSQWKYALIENEFRPFLVQDITPYSLRVPQKFEASIHLNSLFRLTSIELALTDEAITFYTKLLESAPSWQNNRAYYGSEGKVPIQFTQRSSESPGLMKAIHLLGRESIRMFDLQNRSKTHGVRFELWLDEY